MPLESGWTPRVDEETRGLLAAVLDTAGVAMCVVGPDDRIVAANAEWLRATDVDASGALGHPILEMFGPARELVEQLVSRARSGEMVAVPRHLQRIGGRETWWEGQIIPVPMASGRGMLVVAREVTADMDERARAQQAAQVQAAWSASERDLAMLRVLQGIGERLWAAETTREVAAVLEALSPLAGVLFTRLWRLEGESLVLVSRSVEPVPSVPLAAHGPIADASRAREPVFLETPEALEAAYGRERVGEGAVAVLPLLVGDRCVGCLELVYTGAHTFDRAEREILLGGAVQAAHALERAHLFELECTHRAAAERAAYEQAEALGLLDALFENAPLGMAYNDRELRFRRVNPGLARFNGRPAAAHLGFKPSEILRSKSVAIEVERLCERLLATGESISDYEVSGELPEEPGRLRSWRGAYYPVRVKGEIVGIGSIVRETTREREAEQFRRHLLGIVSHDLRMPLAALRLGAESLPKLGPLGESQQAVAARMQSSAFHMQRMIDELLDFALAGTREGIPIDRVPASVDDICTAVIEQVRAAHPDREIRYEREAGDPGGFWDPARVQQALGNLIENALKHGDPSSPVRVHCSLAEAAVTVEVVNAGKPIPPELLPQLFEPLQRGATPPGRGAGLGLYIARQLARAHGGEVDASSNGGETTFRVVLPRR